ncbi:MAG: zinc ABC transporter substrate-binding protein, partial [Bacteroidia bacterium]|nr:zinc ABC transporter substrate-binding protein [Bacteroidia bacterium]
MKKIWPNIALLVLLLFFTLSTTAKLKVLATTTFIADIAENIAGDNLEVVCLMPIGGDPHIYDPTPGDAQKVVDSDLVLKNGLFLEGWLNELIENAGGSRPIIAVSDRIEPIASQVYHGSPDPHAWMNAANGIIYAQNIANALIQIDSQHAEAYNENFLSYKAKLTQLDQYIKNSIL